MGTNYFNTLPLRLQLEELSQCRFNPTKADKTSS